MELAVNFSPALARLLEAGDVEVDRIKVPDWEELITAASALRPIYVHFPYQAGATIETVEPERAARLLRETGTRLLNLHVAPSRERFPEIAVDDVSPAAKRAVVDALVQDVEVAKAALAAGSNQAEEPTGAAGATLPEVPAVAAGATLPEVPAVAIENLIYRGPDRSLLRAGVEPDVLHAVIDATGCALVLDLSHARISAEALGVDPWRYLDAMPVAALRELHMTGVHRIGDESKDHLPLLDDDWRFFEGALARIAAGAWAPPDVVAFEYGGVGPVFDWRSEPEVLRDQVPRLLERVHA
ncbi:MAG: DUF692 family protein [Trueperaceae bacterium]